jgi:hypothetical protein
LIYLLNSDPEYSAVFSQWRMHTGLAQRIPEDHLVAGKYRHTEIFLERRNDADRAEAVSSEENSFGPGGTCARANPDSSAG